jgi:hypothetical protein
MGNFCGDGFTVEAALSLPGSVVYRLAGTRPPLGNYLGDGNGDGVGNECDDLAGINMPDKPEIARPFLRFGVIVRGEMIGRTKDRGEAATMKNRHSMAYIIDLEEEGLNPVIAWQAS